MAVSPSHGAAGLHRGCAALVVPMPAVALLWRWRSMPVCVLCPDVPERTRPAVPAARGATKACGHAAVSGGREESGLLVAQPLLSARRRGGRATRNCTSFLTRGAGCGRFRRRHSASCERFRGAAAALLLRRNDGARFREKVAKLLLRTDTQDKALQKKPLAISVKMIWAPAHIVFSGNEIARLAAR